MVPSSPNPSFLRVFALCSVALLLSGCAVHYYDRKSGTEHLWGMGHLKMKAAPVNEGLQAVVKGHETLGLELGAGEDDYRISAGWQYRRQIVVSSNTSVRLEWPDGDFFNVRVGSQPPWMLNKKNCTNSPTSKQHNP